MDTTIFLALDFPTWKETEQFLQEHDLKGVPVKVGMELFYREGPSIIEKLKKDDHAIFLDLKLYDIPTTVQRAMRNLAGLGIDLVNVHALGGTEMMKAAKEGLVQGAQSDQTPMLIGVTVLTSMKQQTLQQELNVSFSVDEAVAHFAQMTRDAGADGVVCSALEVPKIKKICGSNFVTVTPGIRLVESSHDDQDRVATPKMATENGSDYLVIGRSITRASNPKAAYQRAVKECFHVH
ncbi:orotidine-5'-phosphate decarboxylase [Radiobacillus kanasensis]|uniref:orotidine-5'-phosphate decarboxylase n=1 Tax=Radiobacillus kanasensis TaxID=2844358 RepID=UPI001E4E51ED|nr:orotidine-5'-phosphate decarboxylase [Radiobacillus kanasensis]UFU00970.1 orotidine-5'-phosphate decarboxylase [Radiobacillus kanasensis]